MLFNSRKKIHLISRIFAYIWPRSGWNRFIRYLTLRIKRLPGSPHKIALGFSFGAMSAMTPFFGIHFLIGMFLSWLFRGSIAASIIGNLIGNPWTFPFIVLVNYKIGKTLFFSHQDILFNLENVYKEFILFFNSILLIIFEGNFNNFIELMKDLEFIPAIFYGSIFTCSITLFISYFIMKKIIIKYQYRRAQLKFEFKK